MRSISHVPKYCTPTIINDIAVPIPKDPRIKAGITILNKTLHVLPILNRLYSIVDSNNSEIFNLIMFSLLYSIRKRINYYYQKLVSY